MINDCPRLGNMFKTGKNGNSLTKIAEQLKKPMFTKIKIKT